MAEESGGKVIASSAGGIAGKHTVDPASRVLVGPSTSVQFNVVRPGLFPIACWRVEDMRFDFDSSFVRPEIAEEMIQLASLMKQHEDSPLSLFGHADPVGEDEYNKALSGRRVVAVYAMLTRDVDKWEHLYSNPLGGDDWGRKSIQVMLQDLGYPPGTTDGQRTDEYVQALKHFQSVNGLPANGNAEKATRKKLFLCYMDHNCRDAEGRPFQLTRDNFLARGADSGGRGDYQGCGEFCPLLMFSAEESEEYKDPEKKEARDADNAPNRRVVAFLFRARSRIDHAHWPCARASEGTQRCRKRFWSDSPKRRSFQENRREYSKDRDTFACRFYDRMARGSPCETVLRLFKIRLLDPFAKPIPYAPYEVVSDKGGSVRGKADGDGWAFSPCAEIPRRAKVSWGYPPEEGEPTNAAAGNPPRLPFSKEVVLAIDGTNDQDGAGHRLNNLGYSGGKTLSDKIKAFQFAYGMPQTGRLEDIKEDLWRYHDSASPEPLPDSSIPEEEFHE